MSDAQRSQDSLREMLFSKNEGKVFAILDGASASELLDRLYGDDGPEFECLYPGELEPDMAEAAPYVALLAPGSEFAGWVIREGWGKHWGVFAVSQSELKAVRKHLSNLLTHYNAEGKPLLFRYYDPRVLREYLPKCDAKELQRMFGSIQTFVVESEDAKSAIRFQRDAGSLKQESTSLTGAL